MPAGYADGLDTRAAGRTSVLVRGRRAPIVGSVCMDMITVDVTGTDVSPGDEVVLIGRQGDEEITAREIAAAIGSIPWEVLCRLGSTDGETTTTNNLNELRQLTNDYERKGLEDRAVSTLRGRLATPAAETCGRMTVRIATSSSASSMQGSIKAAGASVRRAHQAEPIAWFL